MTREQIWDPLVRIFHWSVVAGVAANALFTDPEEELHHWIGYAIAGLVALRLVWGLVGSRYARFASFPPSVGAALRQAGDMASGRRTAHKGHSPLGAFMVYNLLATLALICLTGWMMTTNAFFGIDWVEEAHEAAVTWAEISALVHIAAVAVESLRTRVNLPSAMITGHKDLSRASLARE